MVKKYPKGMQSNPSHSTNLLLRLDLEFLVKVVSVSVLVNIGYYLQNENIGHDGYLLEDGEPMSRKPEPMPQLSVPNGSSLHDLVYSTGLTMDETDGKGILSSCMILLIYSLIVEMIQFATIMQ